MASKRPWSATRRDVRAKAADIESLPPALERRIPPEDFDRYKAQASVLRAEAIRHPLRLVRTTDRKAGKAGERN